MLLLQLNLSAMQILSTVNQTDPYEFSFVCKSGTEKQKHLATEHAIFVVDEDDTLLNGQLKQALTGEMHTFVGTSTIDRGLRVRWYWKDCTLKGTFFILLREFFEDWVSNCFFDIG